jgi:hypothetical protein
MKKVMTKFLALSSMGLLMLSACKKDGTLVTSNGGKAGTLTASVTNLPLDKTKLADSSIVISFTFTKPNYGYSAAVTNTLQIDAAGDNWANPMSVTLGTKSYTQGYSTADFNNLLLKLNLTAGVSSQINVRVEHTISANVAPIYSNVLSLAVTPFNLASWVYVPGAYEGSTWPNPGPMEDSLYSATGNGIYTGIINFPAGDNQFLIVPKKTWDNKWATSAPGVNPTGTQVTYPVVYNGPNNFYAPVAPGNYQVTLDTKANTLSIVPVDYYSVIGDAAQGWGTDVDMKYINDGSMRWVVTTPLTVELPPNDGYKIRKDHAWGTSWGTVNPADGKSLTSASGNINIGSPVAGTFTISFWLNPADATGTTAFYTAVKQ